MKAYICLGYVLRGVVWVFAIQGFLTTIGVL